MKPADQAYFLNYIINLIDWQLLLYFRKKVSLTIMFLFDRSDQNHLVYEMWRLTLKTGATQVNTE